MESVRQNKVARLIQKELGMLFQSELRDICGTTMVTVTKIRMTKDLSIAHVFLSIFASPDKHALFERIEESRKEIRHRLIMRIHNKLRIMPILEFHIDDTLDYIEHIEELLKK